MPSRPTSPGSKPSPAVYRRRRLVAALLALVLLVLVGWGLVALVRAGIGALASDDADSSASAAPTPVHSPSPAPPTDAESSSATPTMALEDAPECQPSDLRIAASADRPQYKRGEEAELHLGVTNLSSNPCRTDVGTARQEFKVRTAEGDDVFSTRICQAEPQEAQRVLYPHEELTAVYRWSGHASNRDCGRPGALAAPGPHLLTVSLGDVTSRPVALKILEEVAPGAWDGRGSGTPSPSGGASPSGSASGSASAAPSTTAGPSPSSPSSGAPGSGAAPSAPSSRAATEPPAEIRPTQPLAPTSPSPSR